MIVILIILLLANISLAGEFDECSTDADCSENDYGTGCVEDQDGKFCGCSDASHCATSIAGKVCGDDNLCGCATDTDCSQGTCKDFEDEGYTWKECESIDTGATNSGSAQTLTTCSSSSECTNPELSVCDAGECVECASDIDCTTSPYGSLCDTSTMICVQDAAQQLDTTIQVVDYENIDSEIKEILEIPNQAGYSVEMKKRIASIPTSFSKINPKYLSAGITEEDVLVVNSDVDVRTSMKFFTYSTPSSSQDLTLVKKTIKTGTKGFNIIEEVPQQMGSVIDDLYFTIKPTQVSTNPLAISISVNDKSTEFYYITQGNAIDQVSKIQTIIVPTKSQTRGKGSYKEARCGDGICVNFLEDEISCPEDCKMKVRWGWIITLVIMLTGGVFLINFYIKKKKTKIATLFKTPKDEESLKTYVSTALKSGKAKQDIKIILINKGWSSIQVDYIFRKIGK